MTKLLFATRNRGKLAELHALVAPYGLEVVSLHDLSDMAEVDEDQPTFAGNAEKKARAAMATTGLPSLADDSGLEVDALGGAPGVLSARYAGPGHDDDANNDKLLDALRGIPPERRTARFRCVLALVDQTGAVQTTSGTLEGRIADAPRGTHGFGYDPLFLVGDGSRTLAELPAAEKNRISHRAQAMREMAAKLANALATPRRIP
jgi:XTP/dITP diphosphohydrolase